MMTRVWRDFKWSILALYDGHTDFSAYRRLVRQEGMSPSRIAGLRRRKTRRLVRECLQHVPYYGDLMRSAGISADLVRGPEDLEVLPLLTRSIVRSQGTKMLNQAADPARYFAHTTGGSTGAPLDFYRGREYDRLANSAANMRAWRRMGWRPGDSTLRFWFSHDREDPPEGAIGRSRRFVRRWLQPPDTTIQIHDTSPEVIGEWVGRVRALRPAYLYGYGSVLTLFANYLHRSGSSIEGIRGIASTAEVLLPRARELLRQAFPGAIIIDIYGSREVPGIASECARGTMHVNSDLVHVEYLPDPFEPERHRLILTALDNTVFPFIRYDIGDQGSPLLEPCPCGLPFPAMRWGFGRVADYFVTPEGRLIYSAFFEDLMYGIRGVHRYQFLQESERDIILSIVPCEGFDDSARSRLALVQEAVQRGFSPLARVQVRIVEDIPRTASGKHLYLVSKVDNPLLSKDTDPRFVS